MPAEGGAVEKLHLAGLRGIPVHRAGKVERHHALTTIGREGVVLNAATRCGREADADVVVGQSHGIKSGCGRFLAVEEGGIDAERSLVRMSNGEIGLLR